MRQVLDEHAFPFRSIKFLASERSAGKTLTFRGKTYTVEPIRPEAFAGVDIVLSSTPALVSREASPLAARQGAVVIDNSSAWRMDPEVPLTTARVPVRICHCEAINLEFERPITVEQARAALRRAPGVVLTDDARGEVPLPLHVAGRDEVFVGRVRRDPTLAYGLNLWVVADNLRKGAATNAVQIAEVLVQRGWLPGQAFTS